MQTTRRTQPTDLEAGREGRRSAPGRRWALWLASTLAFPAAGLAGRAVAGPVDGVGPALLGGLVTGAVVGAAQGALSARRLPVLGWAVATALGASIGLAAGSAAVGYGTSLADLVVMGAVTGLAVGAAQAVVLARRLPGWRRLGWAVATAGVLAAGWAVTALAGVDVEARYTTFGATGALVATVLAGLLVQTLPERTR